MDICNLQYYTQVGEFYQVFSILKNDNFGDVEVPDLENNTLLHISSANNHCQIVETLIKNGADIETMNSLGWTPLMQAARQGHCHVVKILLGHGANFHKRNRLGMSALMLACASGDIETVRTLIDAVGRINEDFEIVNSPICSLMIAALYGNDSIIRLLLDKGVNANITTKKTGITPLMFAAYGGSLTTVEILLERGAKLDVLNVSDYSAVDISFIYDKHDINGKMKLAMSSPGKKTDKPLRDIMDAIKQGNIQAVQEILFNDHAKVETVTLEGATPLMVAAMLGNVNVAKLLVHYKANLDAQDYANGWTPLMQAIYHRKSEMAKFLILEGADVNISSIKGYTAFDLANETLDTDVLQMFAEIQNNYLHGTKYRQNPTSPTVQHMKQLWSKITIRPEVVTVRRNSSEQRAPFNQTPYVAAAPEPIMRGLSSDPNEIVFGNIFDELNEIQKETYKMMEPPIICTAQEDIPDGSRTKLGNGFTFNNLVKKFDRSIEKKQNLTVLNKVVANHLAKKPDIKINIEPCDKFASPRSYGNLSDLDVISFDSLSASLIDEIKDTIGPNKFRELLLKLNMEQYIDTIEEQEIDIEAFLLLTRADLIGIGIVAPHKLRKIVKFINKIKELRK